VDAIVVAEDDALLRHALEEVLSEFGPWMVCTVGDGLALLETLTNLIPALVVLDVELPHLDGITAYRRLREWERTREVPVLFLAAAPHLVWGADLEGHFEVLAKPFDLAFLERRVFRLTGHAAA
jgi:CheY-like chemotaxis protein